MSTLKAAAAILAVLACACSRPDSAAETKPAARPVKITQFYPSQPSYPKGEKALLCYGVESAAKVRLEPAVEELSPALTRCFEVDPVETTTYTLIAEGTDGSAAKQTATVVRGGKRPALDDLSINKNSVRAGEAISFCFAARDAVEVTGSPGKITFSRGRIKGCLMHKPRQTTTYELTARNAEGLTDTARMTVEVKP